MRPLLFPLGLSTLSLLACLSASPDEVTPSSPAATPAEAAPASEGTPVPGAADGLRMLSRSIERNSGNCEDTCAKIAVGWMQFEGSPAAAPLNTWVTSQVTITAFEGPPPPSVEAMAEGFLQGWASAKTEGEAMGWELERHVTLVWSSDRLVSLAASEYSYLGGAHPNTTTRYATFRRESGALVRLDDIFLEGFEAALQPHLQAALEAQFGVPFSEIGLDAEPGKIPLAQGWSLDADSLSFNYNPYEIAAYVMGAPTADIPRTAIAALIRPDSPW